MKFNDVKIARVTIAPEAKITKGNTWSGSPGFFIAIIYTLADGRTFPSSATTRKKKELLAHVAGEQRAADAGQLAASFDEHGKFYGTMRSFCIGYDSAPVGGGALPVTPEPSLVTT